MRLLKKLNYMEDLEREISKFATKGKLILQGDFNARCSNVQDAVTFGKYFSENNDIVDIPANFVPNIPRKKFLRDSEQHKRQKVNRPV